MDILHRVGIEGSLDDVYDAIATREGLAAWWTEDTTGDSSVDGVLQFRFPAGGFDMLVEELEPAKLVRWQVVDGPEEWVGTTVHWQLHQVDDFVIVMFQHRGWREPVEFMHHCSTKWASYLLSLKALVETGSGQPAPHDVRIGNWD